MTSYRAELAAINALLHEVLKEIRSQKKEKSSYQIRRDRRSNDIFTLAKAIGAISDSTAIEIEAILDFREDAPPGMEEIVAKLRNDPECPTHRRTFWRIIKLKNEQLLTN